MRRPIQVQLLFPFLSVVLLAIVLASGTIACLGVNRANRRQQDDLARVVATLTDATFPLSKDVLRQMSGLSGAEFVVFDADSRLLEHTLPLAADELESLRRLPEGSSPDVGRTVRDGPPTRKTWFRRAFRGSGRSGSVQPIAGDLGTDLFGLADAGHAGEARPCGPIGWWCSIPRTNGGSPRGRRSIRRCDGGGGGPGGHCGHHHLGAAFRSSHRRTRTRRRRRSPRGSSSRCPSLAATMRSAI